MTHAKTLLLLAIAALVAGALMTRPSGDGPNPDFVTPGVGWVCQGDECRRASDARTMHRAAPRDQACLFTFARPDGSVEYVAAPSRRACEDMRDLYLDLAPTACGWSK